MITCEAETDRQTEPGRGGQVGSRQEQARPCHLGCPRGCSSGERSAGIVLERDAVEGGEWDSRQSCGILGALCLLGALPICRSVEEIEGLLPGCRGAPHLLFCFHRVPLSGVLGQDVPGSVGPASGTGPSSPPQTPLSCPIWPHCLSPHPLPLAPPLFPLATPGPLLFLIFISHALGKDGGLGWLCGLPA